MKLNGSGKSVRCFFIFGTLSALMLICSSCILLSNFPLSDSNNCHETKLEGTWLREEKTNGKKQTRTVVITDEGEKYRSKSAEEKNGCSFILTKLDSYYFISIEADDGNWLIFRIRLKDREFTMLGLNDQGLELYKEISEEKNKKRYMKISQRELQQWCVRNAELFTVELGCYTKAK